MVLIILTLNTASALLIPFFLSTTISRIAVLGFIFLASTYFIYNYMSKKNEDFKNNKVAGISITAILVLLFDFFGILLNIFVKF